MSTKEVLLKRHELLRVIREFFYGRGYIELETPNLMATAPPDPHIDPLETFIQGRGPFYLHTSPEMYMKKLLQSGVGRIFQICKVYRVEQFEDVHNVEFTMLEWYREGTYAESMKETERLVERCLALGDNPYNGEFPVFDLEDLVFSTTGINPFGLDTGTFLRVLQNNGFPGVDEMDDWNSLFFKLFIQHVEAALPQDKPYFIKDWPSTISTMAREKGGGKVERFELYKGDLELANGYTELTDAEEQRGRFEMDNAERVRMGKPVFPLDEGFLSAVDLLEDPCTGVSLGVDRLLMIIMGMEKIGGVLPNRVNYRARE